MADILAQLKKATWEDLTEVQPWDTRTFHERNINLIPEWIRSWEEHGVLRLNMTGNANWMALLENYSEIREKLSRDRSQADNFYSGWANPTPYHQCLELCELATSEDLIAVLNFLLNDAALFHLALTGWVSTERNWHQDSYLNPPNVWSSYAAVWVALDDIHEDSGPFEYIPGSHKWEVLRRDNLFNFLPEHVRQDPAWPSITQGEVARVCEEKIAKEGVRSQFFVPEKGEILIWHPNLLHRGSTPKNPDLLRKAVILHYSGLHARKDMQQVQRYGHGFMFGGKDAVRMI